MATTDSPYTNQPGHQYDRPRVEQLRPIKAAIEQLRLPPIRYRKVGTIVNALELQIEDGGDTPEVNQLLLDALRAGIVHQVGMERAQPALHAIADFEEIEAERWGHVQSGTLPPIERSPDEQLDDLVYEASKLIQARKTAAACDRWLEAWELVKQLTRPEWRTIGDFDRTYRGGWDILSNWSQELASELGNAGRDDPVYHECRLRYVREFLQLFPDEDEACQVQFGRAEGEALFGLGRRAEAEAVYERLVKRFPDNAWAYIGWSDNYQWPRRPASGRDYGKAEVILLRALERPNLTHPTYVLERLDGLYEVWDKPEKRPAIQAERKRLASGQPRTTIVHHTVPAQPTTSPGPPPGAKRLGRNDPCWCGSGKKYKHCHMGTR